MNYTPGNWDLGWHKDTVTTNHTKGANDHHVDYYGGRVIAESIRSDADRRLISAAPELLEALEEIYEQTANKIEDPEFWAKAYSAIKKARGEN